MGTLIKEKQHKQAFRGVGKLSIVSIFIALCTACLSTIWAIYLDSFVNSVSIVGFVSAFLMIIGFSSRFIFIPLIEKNRKDLLLVYSLLLSVVLYIIFGIVRSFALVLVFAVIYIAIFAIQTITFALIVKHNSERKQLARNEGLIYTCLNISYVIGPLIAGFVMASFGIRPVFFLIAGFALIALLVFKISKIEDATVKKRLHWNIIKNFRSYFSSSGRVSSYIMSAGVTFWWALIYLFVPLLIVRSGFGGQWVGYFLFAAAVPLILTEYSIGKAAGRHGFKRFFKIGFLIACFFAFACFFLSNVFLIMGALILASFGIAMLEPTVEAYFFDTLKEGQENRFYGIYSTSDYVGGFIGKILPATIVLFLPFKYIFLVFGGITLLIFILTFGMREIVEEKRRR